MKRYSATIHHVWEQVGKTTGTIHWYWVVSREGYGEVARGHRQFRSARGAKTEADRVLEALKKTKGKYT